MKKHFLTLLLSILPIMLWADAVEIDGIYYNLISKAKQAEVTANPNKYQGNIAIPASVMYDNLIFSVTALGDQAFSHCTNLTSVTIPNSVISIGSFAFSYCTNLTSVTIPNSVTDIGRSAFSDCTGLTSVTIPNSVTTVPESSFSGCTSLTSVTIPNSVTSLGSYVFSGCKSLTSVTIPNSVTRIDGHAFEGCTGLISVTIPNSVTVINSFVFYNCTGLTSVTIPNSVSIIDYSAFSYCTSLTSVTIPNSVTRIDGFAFEGCTGLGSIIIGSGIKDIFESFANCKNLTDVYCYAENVPNTSTTAFKNSYVEYATLHVPANAINKYKEKEPWKNFGNIVALDGAITPKCETPIINYENGVLKMTCATEGVEYVTDITDVDVKKHYDAEISLSATYNISVYATKAGHDNSDMVNATLCWIDAEPKAEGITNGVANVSTRAVLIQNYGGVITVNGVKEGTRVSAYSISGVEEASAISRNGAAVLNTNAKSGSTVIINLGEKSVKVLMK